MVGAAAGAKAGGWAAVRERGRVFGMRESDDEGDAWYVEHSLDDGSGSWTPPLRVRLEHPRQVGSLNRAIKLIILWTNLIW